MPELLQVMLQISTRKKLNSEIKTLRPQGDKVSFMAYIRHKMNIVMGGVRPKTDWLLRVL